MTDTAERQEILSALETFHAAQKAGNVDAMLDGLTNGRAFRFVSNGVPHGKTGMRSFFEAQAARGVHRDVKLDLSRCAVAVDTSSEHAKLSPNAVAEPVIYDGPAGRNVWSYTMLKDPDGRWRIVNQRVIPHPDEPAITAEILAGAGRPLRNLAMVWTRKLEVSLEDVWRAVSTTEGLHTWWLGGPANGHRGKVAIDLRVGGLFFHNWRSEIHELRERSVLDFGEFRFDLRPDGKGTLFSLTVFSMDGVEWRAFYRCDDTPLYRSAFGGLDPWSARSWHGVVDRLEHVLTGRVFEDPSENVVYSYALTRFYLVYLRELHAQRQISSRPPLMGAGWQLDEGFARTERPMDEETRKAKMYELLRLRLETHEPQSILAIEHEVAVPVDLVQMAREQLPGVAEHLARCGATPAGPPVVRILRRSRESIRFDFGYPISGDVPGEGRIQRRELAGGAIVVAELGERVGGTQSCWPWMIRYAQEQGFALDPGPGGEGGWQTLPNEAASAGERGASAQLRLPVSKSQAQS